MIEWDCTVVRVVHSDSKSLLIIRVKLRGVKNSRYGIGSSSFVALAD